MVHFELGQELHTMRLGNLTVPRNKDVLKQNKKKKKKGDMSEGAGVISKSPQ